MQRKIYAFTMSIVLIMLFSVITTSQAFAEGKNSCVECHNTLGEESQKIVKDWEASIHAKGAACADCHGGNPAESDREKSMDKKAGFIGVPKPEEIPDLCAKCHSDAEKMRPFNLTIGQLEQYKTSVHGKKLFEDGVSDVATCSSCHGGHKILPHNDPASMVYKTNIPGTCSKCHSDEKLMKKFNLTSDQYEKYAESIHGVKLLKDLDKGAPSCADCHGIHGATPPGVKEIAEVCGNCHSQTEKYFEEGAHGKAYASVGMPRCIDCHAHHDIKPPSDDMFVTESKGVCHNCHTEGTKPFEVATDYSKLFKENESRLAVAEEEIKKANELSTYMDEITGDLDDARTSMIEAKALQHTVSLEKVKEKIHNSLKILESLDQKVNSILQEHVQRKNFAVVGGILWILAALVIIIRVVTLPNE